MLEVFKPLRIASGEWIIQIHHAALDLETLKYRTYEAADTAYRDLSLEAKTIKQGAD